MQIKTRATRPAVAKRCAAKEVAAMRVGMQGTTFLVIGSFRKSRFYVWFDDYISAHGGRVVMKASQKPDVAIVGDRPSKELIRAKNLGIPIMTQGPDLEALLEGDEIEIVDPMEQGDESLDVLMGEARSMLSGGAPGPARWSAITALLDRAHPDHVGALSAYFEGYVGRWGQAQMADLASDVAMLKEGEPDPRLVAQWDIGKQDRAFSRGELRVAPESWVPQLMEHKVRSPKFQLVRALDLSQSRLSSTHAIRAMRHPDLTSLTRLALPNKGLHTRTLMRELCKPEFLMKLDHVTLFGLKMDAAEELARASEGVECALRHLALAPADYWRTGGHEVTMLWRSDYVQKIEALTTSGHHSALRALTEASKAIEQGFLGDLRELNLAVIGGKMSGQYSEYAPRPDTNQAVMHQLHTLALRGVAGPSNDYFRALLKRPLRSLRTLDLSALQPAPDESVVWGVENSGALLLKAGVMVDIADVIFGPGRCSDQLREALDGVYPGLRIL